MQTHKQKSENANANSDISSFHGLSLSPGAASHPDTGRHDLPTQRKIYNAGAIVQPVAPLDCCIWQTWEDRPGSSKLSSVSMTLADWRSAGYNVSTIQPVFLTNFLAAYSLCLEFGPVWTALSHGAAGHDVYPDFFLDDQAGLQIPSVCANVGEDGSAERNARNTIFGPLREGQHI